MEKLPYLNVPVYVVHLRDGEGCSQTLHRNYLLPVNSNIGQDEKDAPVAGVENNITLTPAPPVDSVPAYAGPSGMVTPSAAGSTPQGSPNQPAALRCGTQKTWNWLPWRHQNFGLHAGTRPPNVWDAWAGLHAISSQNNAFWGSTVWNHTLLLPSCVCQALLSFGIEGNSFPVVSMVDLWIVGEWTKDYLAQAQLLHCKKFQHSIPIKTQGVHSSPTQKTSWQT